MKKKCRFCGREFNAGYNAALYCSPVCAGAARTRAAKERNAAYAAKIGLTLEELEREIKMHRISKREIAAGAPHRKGPKTYRQIQYENRQRRVVGGWRGQPVLCGGHTFRCEAPIRASELPRMTTGFKCVDLRTEEDAHRMTSYQPNSEARSKAEIARPQTRSVCTRGALKSNAVDGQLQLVPPCARAATRRSAMSVAGNVESDFTSARRQETENLPAGRASRVSQRAIL